jgi:ABC-type glycerol-3-phosphate transport system substrate-binding protein
VVHASEGRRKEFITMNTRTKKTLAGLAAVMLVGACSGTDAGDIDSAIDDATATAVDQAEEATNTTLTAENAEAIAKLQTSMDVVSAEFQDADLGADLAVAWTEIQARITDAVQTNASFDASELRAMIDTIESQVALDANPEFASAWAEFRAEFDEFVASS